MNIGIVVAGAAAAGGLGALLYGLTQRAPASDPSGYLDSLDRPDDVVVDEFEERLQLPFVTRVIRPFGSSALGTITSLTPGGYVAGIQKKLAAAGIEGSIRAEEFAAAQVIGVLSVLALTVAYALFAGTSPRIGILVIVGLPLVTYLASQSWLERKVQERKDAIFKDLPDVLDLLSISVEAGVGFEGALDVVCSHFDSPLAREFSRTLKEMELGLPRKEALHNLKNRCEVPELSNFVLAMTQADSLGMPIGRVLHTQAIEMRNKRRQWAREKAAKLPVKIMFPLVLFIFPAILIVLLGPAGSKIVQGLG